MLPYLHNILLLDLVHFTLRQAGLLSLKRRESLVSVRFAYLYLSWKNGTEIAPLNTKQELKGSQWNKNESLLWTMRLM